MKKVKILFQGDSITDAYRDKRNYHHMGIGYPKYAAELIAENNPDVEFEFINFGISGNRTSNLFDRLYTDGIAFEPDIISILIGINDIWARHGGEKIATTDAQIELNYRCILERLRKETKAKIVILAPYLLKTELPYAESFRNDLNKVLPIVRKLAAEFADVYVPLDEHFAVAEPLKDPYFYSGDGVHPNPNGAKFIGKLYAEAIQPLIDKNS